MKAAVVHDFRSPLHIEDTPHSRARDRRNRSEDRGIILLRCLNYMQLAKLT
jgi:hypothetical protein